MRHSIIKYIPFQLKGRRSIVKCYFRCTFMYYSYNYFGCEIILPHFPHQPYQAPCQFLDRNPYLTGYSRDATSAVVAFYSLGEVAGNGQRL